jgi:hypothetical protein
VGTSIESLRTGLGLEWNIPNGRVQARAGHLEEFKVEFSLPEANNPQRKIMVSGTKLND